MDHFEQLHSYLPIDLREPKNFVLAMAVALGFLLLRYFSMVGAFHFLLYRLGILGKGRGQIYDSLPGAQLQWYEIKWSLVSSLIFALSTAVLGLLWQTGQTKIYLGFKDYGWPYFFGSPLLMSLLHEIYFYATHRLLHVRWIFRRVHYVHHESLTPSPWASFSFHPFEALIQAAALPLLTMILPIHPLALIVYLTFMTVSAISNHSGFELLPQSLLRYFVGWFISGAHHSLHHKHYRFNFGLFYTFLDHLFRTEDPEIRTTLQRAFGSDIQ